MKKFCGLLVISALFALSSCSMFSQSSRQQAAYQRYVRKCSANRAQQQKLFNSSKPRMPIAAPDDSQPTETASADNSQPESVTANSQ